jgi:hypothetical protein
LLISSFYEFIENLSVVVHLFVLIDVIFPNFYQKFLFLQKIDKYVLKTLLCLDRINKGIIRMIEARSRNSED